MMERTKVVGDERTAPSPEVLEKRMRRRFTVEYKAKILAGAAHASPQERCPRWCRGGAMGCPLWSKMAYRSFVELAPGGNEWPRIGGRNIGPKTDAVGASGRLAGPCGFGLRPFAPDGTAWHQLATAAGERRSTPGRTRTPNPRFRRRKSRRPNVKATQGVTARREIEVPTVVPSSCRRAAPVGIDWQ